MMILLATGRAVAAMLSQVTEAPIPPLFFLMAEAVVPVCPLVERAAAAERAFFGAEETAVAFFGAEVA